MDNNNEHFKACRNEKEQGSTLLRMAPPDHITKTKKRLVVRNHVTPTMLLLVFVNLVFFNNALPRKPQRVLPLTPNRTTDIALSRSRSTKLYSPTTGRRAALPNTTEKSAARQATRATVKCKSLLVERDEARGVGRSDTRPAVADGLVCDRELAKVVSHHLGLDLHTVHRLT